MEQISSSWLFVACCKTVLTVIAVSVDANVYALPRVQFCDRRVIHLRISWKFALPGQGGRIKLCDKRGVSSEVKDNGHIRGRKINVNCTFWRIVVTIAISRRRLFCPISNLFIDDRADCSRSRAIQYRVRCLSVNDRQSAPDAVNSGCESVNGRVARRKVKKRERDSGREIKIETEIEWKGESWRWRVGETER